MVKDGLCLLLKKIKGYNKEAVRLKIEQCLHCPYEICLLDGQKEGKGNYDRGG